MTSRKSNITSKYKNISIRKELKVNVSENVLKDIQDITEGYGRKRILYLTAGISEPTLDTLLKDAKGTPTVINKLKGALEFLKAQTVA